MGIEVDWQIIEGEQSEPEVIAAPPPPRPRRKLPRWLVAVALAPVAAVAILAVYVTTTYRTLLARATQEIMSVARLEAQAVAANDRLSFMALQDPDDAAFRATQERRYGQLDRLGLPEFGLSATSATQQFGSVSLEPGIAQLNDMRSFSVAQPVPGGPVSVTLNIPQYYKPTASGWVHALPGPDFWGSQQSFAFKRVLALYPRRDADVIEPLVLRVGQLLERVCAELNCPSQVTLSFETRPSAIGGWWSSVYSGDKSTLTTLTLALLSPHLSGLPTDDRSRDELYRAIEIQVVSELVIAIGPVQRSRFNSAAYQQLLRWYLAQAGLTGPFITSQITSTLAMALRDGTWQPLDSISLDAYSTRSGTVGDVMVPLAFDFIARRLGTDSLVKLAPAIGSNPTLGDAIRAVLRVNSMSLESDWQAYLRVEAGLASYVTTALPKGELALECMTGPSAISSSIFRIHADGTGLTSMTDRDQSGFYPAWSPDGQRLAFAQGDQVVLMDASDRRVLRTIPGSSNSMFRFGWLPDGELWIGRSGDGRLYRVNVETGQVVEIKGARPISSPDGTRMVYLEYSPDPVIWIADTNGHNAHPVALGYGLTGSPEGGRLAQEMDWGSGLAWSPDGLMIAMTVWRSDGSAFLVIDSRTGVVLAQKRGTTFSGRAWSADGRYVAFQPEPDSSFRAAVGILDMLNDRQLSFWGNDWDWSPDGKWLAVTQKPSGVLLTMPDMSVTRWLDTPPCSNVAWRPSS